MGETRKDRARELFFAVIDMPEERRAAFLSEQCGEDEQLRAEVESLLAQDEGTGEFMDAPVVPRRAATTSDVPASLPAGKRIGCSELRLRAVVPSEDALPDRNW